jgi:hypothetical protein
VAKRNAKTHGPIGVDYALSILPFAVADLAIVSIDAASVVGHPTATLPMQKSLLRLVGCGERYPSAVRPRAQVVHALGLHTLTRPTWPPLGEC